MNHQGVMYSSNPQMAQYLINALQTFCLPEL